jgi:hypothetical protein
MSPCSPNDVSFEIPDGPSGPSIPGFGSPFSLKLDKIPLPDGFPEDLLDLLDKLQMLIPPGILKPALNPNFGKDIFDAIMKMLDQFMPYLMMYKFFLPILKLILCIIEVLCAISNPIKLIKALKRLFRNCLPDFLNLFPLFALIIMIISLLLLLLALIEYIINQIVKFIKMILRNLNALYMSAMRADENSILAIAKKLGAMLCIFQNLFVLLSIFNIIIDIFRDLLSLIFAIPPCDDDESYSEDGCCTSDVCPQIIKTDYTRYTGTFKYLNQMSIQTTVALPGPTPFLTLDIRNEGWQFYDLNQELSQAFINIIDAYDVPYTPKPVFFPTDSTYTASTTPKQAAYVVDLRMYYNPNSWSRTQPADGKARWIRFNNCIVQQIPSTNLLNYDGGTTPINTGVFTLVGGSGTEDNGTVLNGYLADGITQTTDTATLANFLHMPQVVNSNPIPLSTDGYVFSDVEYTFKPHRDVLLSKNIITLGCEPDLAEARAYISNVFANDAGLKTSLLNETLKESNGFPSPKNAQECLSTALSGLRSDFTINGVANFQATSMICLEKLKSDTNKALGTMVGLGFDACKSNFTAEPVMQFTSQPISVTVNIKERNGHPITSNLTPDVATDIAARIKAYTTFGDIANFNYDGNQSFITNITSKIAGSGTLMISFDDNMFCINDIPTDIDQPATHTIQEIDYQFIYSPAGIITPTGTSTAGSSGTISSGDTTNQPRRDEGDISRDGRGA